MSKSGYEPEDDARWVLHEFVSWENTPDGPQGRTQKVQLNPAQVVYIRPQTDGTTKVRVVGQEWLHLADTLVEVQLHLRFMRGMHYF